METELARREQEGAFPQTEGRQLGWYAHLVHNRSLIGSLFTLIHLPFLTAFLSLVLLGALTLPGIEPLVLLLSLLVVALLLYGEHMLDDMTGVGKPWNTVFSDRELLLLATMLFTFAILVGLLATVYFGSLLPLSGVLVGTGFCLLYGFEIWKFHNTEFGALGMGAIAVFSYGAQAITTHSSMNGFVALALGIFGFTYGYVMLALYEHTKTNEHQIAWRLLGLHLIMLYTLVGLFAMLRFF